MPTTAPPAAIVRIICNEDVWYLRLGARLGLYRKDLTHTTLKHGTLAVPRGRVEFWQARLAEFRAGTLADGHAKALLIHESTHARQMAGNAFWWWALRYLLSRRFRRRIEEEAYLAQLLYLAQHGQVIEVVPWMRYMTTLYVGAFNERRAREAMERIVAAVRAQFPDARIVEGSAQSAPYTPWLDDRRG